MNDVRGIVATNTGNIFILDFKTREIRVFDANGRFLRLAARDGAGPGEIRGANGLAIGADDTVWVNDPGNRRFSLYASDGSFARQIPLSIQPYAYIWDGAIDAKGRVVESGILVPGPGGPVSESRTRVVYRDGRADTLAAPECPGSIPQPNPPSLRFTRPDGAIRIRPLPFLAQKQLAVTSVGTIWCTPSSEFRLSVGNVGGPIKEVVHLEVAPVPVPSEARRRELQIIDSLRREWTLERGDPSLTPTTQPTIERITADDSGRVWVRRPTGGKPGISYDVFNASGVHVARVTGIDKPFVPSFIRGDRFYTVVLGDDDVPFVVRYRIKR